MSDINEACATPVSDHVERFWRYLEAEQVRILVDLQRDGYCDSSSFNDEVGKALLAERNAARSTISEQEKRIAELEAERDAAYEACRVEGIKAFEKAAECLAWKDRCEAAEQALTSERQRREEAEAVLQPFAAVPQGLYYERDYRNAHAHFQKYEPGK